MSEQSSLHRFEKAGLLRAFGRSSGGVCVGVKDKWKVPVNDGQIMRAFAADELQIVHRLFAIRTLKIREDHYRDQCARRAHAVAEVRITLPIRYTSGLCTVCRGVSVRLDALCDHAKRADGKHCRHDIERLIARRG